MRKLYYILTIILLQSFTGLSQNSLTAIVVGSQGQTSTSSTNYSVQYTVGEAVILTSSSSNGNILTQGFNQPKNLLSNNLLEVYYTVQNASCIGLLDGAISIDSIVGCDGNYSVSLNGLNVDSMIIDSLVAGEYSLDIQSGDGCSLSETILIAVEGSECDIEFYNAFSPNNDGVNEYWHIEKVEAYPNNTVQVFDRWGVLLWQASGYNNNDIRWEGQSKEGREMLNGTYFYIFQSEGFLNKGYVEITK